MEKKSTEGYVYIGEHYDSLGRPIIPNDKKIGLTIDPPSRESSWSKTKSPYLYRHIKSYFVDDMFRVESLLHAILNSRNTNGEWFEDSDDTLVDDFTNFMQIYGGVLYVPELKEESTQVTDQRLVDLAKQMGETVLIRTYMGEDYEVILTENGLLLFDGQTFDTPNKLYNNGIVKKVKGVRGNSGTNGLSQFKVKSTGKVLGGGNEFGNITLIDGGEHKTFNYDYEYVTYLVKRMVEKVGLDQVVQNNIWVCKNMEDFPDVYLNNYKSAIKNVDGYYVCTWGNKKQKFEMMRKSLELVPELCDELVLKME